jgi:arginine N-succinyltransferase
MTARTDKVKSVAEAVVARLDQVGVEGGERALVAAGELADFRCGFGRVLHTAAGVSLDEDAAKLLGVGPGDAICYVTG